MNKILTIISYILLALILIIGIVYFFENNIVNTFKDNTNNSNDIDKTNLNLKNRAVGNGINSSDIGL